MHYVDKGDQQRKSDELYFYKEGRKISTEYS